MDDFDNPLAGMKLRYLIGASDEDLAEQGVELMSKDEVAALIASRGKPVTDPVASIITPADIIAKARSFKGQLHDGPDVVMMAQAIGTKYPDMAGYVAGIGPSTEWCGVFNAYVHMLLGIRPAYTKNSDDYDDFAWADAPIVGHWGTVIDRSQAQPGDTVVLKVPHHITFLDHDNGDGTFEGTGGNQTEPGTGGGVTTATFKWGNINAVIRAPGAAQPIPSPVMPPVSTASNFKKCLPLVLVHEGGNDDDPRDPGGRTSRGILQREWDVWRQSHPGLPSDVWQAPQDQVEAIYKLKYWDAMSCDSLPSGVDYAVFDYGVNSGIDRSAKVLQQFVNTEVDGEIGSNTIAATLRADPRTLVGQICDERLAFLQGLGTWSTFGSGWTARVSDVRRDALAMAAAPKAVPDPIVLPPDHPPPLNPGNPMPTNPGTPMPTNPTPFSAAVEDAVTQIRPILAKLVTVQPAGSPQDAIDALIRQLGGTPATRITPLLPGTVTPPVTPAPVTPVPVAPTVPTSVQASAVALAIGTILQALGYVGTPLGLGTDPTTAGTLTTLIPVLTGLVGSTGAFSPIASTLLSLLTKVLQPAAK